MTEFSLVYGICSSVVPIQVDVGGSGCVMESSPDILVDTNRLICSPDQSTTEEGEKKHDAIIKLGL